MRIAIRPVADPQREIDLTNRLVSAIAEELWRLYGGNEHLNWLEAERHLERIVSGARREAAEPAPVRTARTPDDARVEPATCFARPRPGTRTRRRGAAVGLDQPVAAMSAGA